MELISNTDLARRLARTIASDLALYNRERLEEGIRNDNVFELLANEIEEGRQHFNSRVAPEIASSNVYDLALVDILIKRSEKIESSIW
ncbi:MAG TPA: hypothetical protein VFR01_01910 [Geobacterales bacterium]|nr:hypothetical protein [Geobacterales bacterium]